MDEKIKPKNLVETLHSGLLRVRTSTGNFGEIAIDGTGAIKDVYSGDITHSQPKSGEIKPAHAFAEPEIREINGRVGLLLLGKLDRQFYATPQQVNDINPPAVSISEMNSGLDISALEDIEDVGHHQEIAEIVKSIQETQFITLSTYLPYVLTVRGLSGDVFQIYTGDFTGAQTFSLGKLPEFKQLGNVHPERLNTAMDGAIESYITQTIKDSKKWTDPLFLYFGQINDDQFLVVLESARMANTEMMMKGGQTRPGDGIHLRMGFALSQSSLDKFLALIKKDSEVAVDLLRYFLPATTTKSQQIGQSIPSNVTHESTTHLPATYPGAFPDQHILNTTMRSNLPSKLHIVALSPPTSSIGNIVSSLSKNPQFREYTYDPSKSEADNEFRKSKNERYRYKVSSSLVQTVDLIPLTD